MPAETPNAASPSSTKSATSAWAPFDRPPFRLLWGVWLTANICMWMNDVAAAWMMTSLASAPIWVALVQSASTLPVFLLGLPSGAFADILDRRRYFMVTQLWVAAVAVLICIAIVLDVMSAPLLLALTFANGMGLAMRWPVFSAIVPELVPRVELPAALALNGVAMNASRILGPIVAGALIASAGSAYVFLLNAVLSIAAAFLVRRWKHEEKPSALPAERFLGAMRVGVQHVRQSVRMHAVLVQVALFFFFSTSLLALLPLIARGLAGGGAGTFTVLLASMGAGAIVAAVLLPRLREGTTRDDVARYGSVLYAIAMVVVGLAPNIYIAAPGMVAAGMAWISVANSMSVSAQIALPNWVRARGMSIYQMALMGSGAIGAAVWGQIATVTQVRVALFCAAAGALIAVIFSKRLKLEHEVEEDLSPAQGARPELPLTLSPDDGPLLVTIEYRIDPAKAEAFREVMQESRRSRLRQGVLSWNLYRDASDPALYTEQFVDETWAEHLRHFERMTAADLALRNRRFSFHVDDGRPRVTRRIAESNVSR